MPSSSSATPFRPVTRKIPMANQTMVRFLFSLMLSIFLRPTYAATLFVDPPSSTTNVGSTISINIMLTDVVDLYAFQFDLSFDPNVLSAVSVSEGAFLSSAGVTAFVPGIIDNVGGNLFLTANTLLTAIPGATGTGVLATAVFSAISSGSSPLTLSNELLLDSNLSTLTDSLLAGQVTVQVVPEPTMLLLLLIGLPFLIFAAAVRPRRPPAKGHGTARSS